MKGIVLAGGTGSRLYPLTISVSKQLLPVYNKPMIFYPINTLIKAGIKEILIITTPEDQNSFKKLLGNGEAFAAHFSYEIQEKPNGIAEAFVIGEKFIGNDNVCLILGDNIFHGEEFESILKNSITNFTPSIFSIPVENASRYGVVELNEKNQIISIEEKPLNPKSNLAIPGIYLYDSSVASIAKRIIPSKRGEKEITDIHNHYLKNGILNVLKLSIKTRWMDAGTFDSLLEASFFVKNLKNEQ